MNEVNGRIAWNCYVFLGGTVTFFKDLDTVVVNCLENVEMLNGSFKELYNMFDQAKTLAEFYNMIIDRNYVDPWVRARKKIDPYYKNEGSFYKNITLTYKNTVVNVDIRCNTKEDLVAKIKAIQDKGFLLDAMDLFDIVVC